MSDETVLNVAVDAVRDVWNDEKVRKTLAAVVLLGLAAYAVAGWLGLLVLLLCLLLASWSGWFRRRWFRWYLLS